MAKEKNETVRIDRHLYRVRYRKMDGRWSVYFLARLKTWDGKNRAIRLVEDLQTSRKLLWELKPRT